MNAAYSKTQSNSKIVLIGSSPYYKISILKLNFLVNSKDLDKEQINKLKLDIEKLNNWIKERLIKKADEISQASKQDIRQFIEEITMTNCIYNPFKTEHSKFKNSNWITK